MPRCTEPRENWSFLASIEKHLEASCLKCGLCKSEKTHPATAPLSFLPIVLLCDGPSMQSLAEGSGQGTSKPSTDWVRLLGGQVHTISNRALHELCNVTTSEEICGIQIPPALYRRLYVGVSDATCNGNFRILNIKFELRTLK